MFFSPTLYVIPVVLIAALVLITASVRILREYERAVIFTLGRFQKVKGPRLVLLIPFFQEMVRVDLRIQVIEIPTQDVISRDNVSMKVDAVLYFNVVNPERAIIQVQSYLPATNMLAQTTLRAVLGQHELDEMLSERKKLSTDVQSILDTQTETWGIKVSNVEIRLWSSRKTWCAPLPNRRKRNATGAPRSSTRKPSSRRRKPLSTPRRSSGAFPPPCSCVTCKR
jgi:regulator of protease activity HflC (stomatin/prohibitin superfamily)